MASTNKEIPVHPHPCNFPCFENVGPPMMATLNLPRLTIDLLVWLFSNPSNLDVYSSQPTCLGSHTHVDPLFSTHVKTFSHPSSSSGESLTTSNQESRKKKKYNKKKN